MSAAPQLGQAPSFELEIRSGPHQGQKFTFSEGTRVTIGRGSDCAVALQNDVRVSRLHAEIIFQNGHYIIKNSNPKNYILVDGVKVENEILNGAPILTIGESEILFRQIKPASPLQLLQKDAPKASSPIVNLTPQKQPLSIPAAPGLPLGPAPSIKHHIPPGGGGFGAASSAPRSHSSPMPTPSADGSNRIRLVLVTLIAGIAVYFFFFNEQKTSKKSKPLRTSEVVDQEFKSSQESIKQLEEKLGKKSILSNKRAEENFIKGFRDYQKGQYLRAKDYFRIVLNLNPDHLEARKYYEQARIRLDKQIDYNFLEGIKNKEKKNFRMCRSYFSQVMILIQNDRAHPKYEEVERYLRECQLALEGGY